MPVDDFPAKKHISSLLAHLVRLSADESNVQEHIIFLQGEHTLSRHDTDRELPFHQEANFHYATGCLVPSATLVIRYSPSAKSEVKLCLPEEDAESSMWSIPPPNLQQAEQMYDFTVQELGFTGVDDVAWMDTLVVQDSTKETLVHVLSAPTDVTYLSYPTPPGWMLGKIASLPATTRVTSRYLQKAFHHARLVKTEQEISYIREACRITSGAHEIVMRELGKFAVGRETKSVRAERNGKEALNEWEIESEGDAEAVFVAACRRAGAGQAYLPIVASGSRASTLHYVCNDRVFPSARHPVDSSSAFSAPSADGQPPAGRGCCGSVPSESFSDLAAAAGPDGTGFLPQVLLIDAGCEYRGGYASDITRTIPVGNGGRYTDEGRQVYEIVLKMQKEAEAICKAGAHWDDLHFLCHSILCQEFLELGIFKDGSVDDLLASGLSQAFFPHGLGHSLGLDVHDSLQLLREEHIDIPARSLQYPGLFPYLRIRRPLLTGMVLTIEPGCYFSPQLMERAGVKESKYVDQDVLPRYVAVGGVRIEDVVVVRADRCENLTTVPREVEQIEAICSGAK
ncbi:hypothetical protein QFC22_001754 [Naganishia vaughanmartiniae]|uniref:Uncharacterized protein n=1 Tax=Naganishia vaughanmartiniae TaxID=1424756 RepID=A0ACC2XE64_9TREE|nr:hypothetical protein QFC22_001754 [Naganishia vaughanmartiniae]